MQPVALKMLRIFSREAPVTEAEKVCKFGSRSFMSVPSISVAVPTRSQPLVLVAASLRASVLWNVRTG